MKELMIQDLKTITEVNSAPMISIYLSRDPHHDIKPISVRWKQAISKAENLLVKDYTRSFVHAFLEPLRHTKILQSLGPLDKGLVVFYSTEEQGFMRVQSNINDLVVVADSFHIKPVLRIKNNERGYFIIGVSSRLITLSVETNGQLYRMDAYRNPSLHDNPEAPRSRSALKDFFSSAASNINKSLINYKLPVIMAGSREHMEQFRRYLTSSYVMDEFISADTELMDTDNLRALCFKVLSPYYRKKELEAVYEFNQALKNRLAITYIEDIALSAVYGKIEKLFVVENRQLWGRVNKQTGEIFLSPKQEGAHEDDVLDDICEIVLAKGGEVIVLKDSALVNGHIAAAIVTDTSRLYDLDHNHTSPGM